MSEEMKKFMMSQWGDVFEKLGVLTCPGCSSPNLTGFGDGRWQCNDCRNLWVTETEKKQPACRGRCSIVDNDKPCEEPCAGAPHLTMNLPIAGETKLHMCEKHKPESLKR